MSTLTRTERNIWVKNDLLGSKNMQLCEWIPCDAADSSWRIHPMGLNTVHRYDEHRSNHFSIRHVEITKFRSMLAILHVELYSMYLCFRHDETIAYRLLCIVMSKLYRLFLVFDMSNLSNWEACWQLVILILWILVFVMKKLSTRDTSKHFLISKIVH